MQLPPEISLKGQVFTLEYTQKTEKFINGTATSQGTNAGKILWLRKPDALKGILYLSDVNYQIVLTETSTNITELKKESEQKMDLNLNPPSHLNPPNPNGPQKLSFKKASVSAVNPVVIDILVAYTQSSQDQVGSQVNMLDTIDLAIEEANQAFKDSNINLMLNLVGTIKTPCNEVNMDTDLGRLANKTDNYADDITTLQNQIKADEVILLGNYANSSYAGLAYIVGTKGTSAYAIVDIKYTLGTGTFVHEIGHNLGCSHDITNAGGPGVFNYSYGYRFTYNNQTYRTIMAYPPGTRIGLFSSPDNNYHGVPVGNATCNNAEAIRQTMNNVASIQTAPSYTLTINKNGTGTIYRDGSAVSGTITVQRGEWVNLTTTTNLAYWSGSSTESTNTLNFFISSNSTITANFNDGQNINRSPTLQVADTTIYSTNGTTNITITIGDVDTALSSLTVTATAKNSTYTTTSEFTTSGTGAQRTIAITPRNSQNGTVPITVTVSDGNSQCTKTFNLTVISSTSITAISTDQAVKLGSKVTFYVAISSQIARSIQWTHESTDIPGATNTSLTIAKVIATDEGTYSVKVTNLDDKSVQERTTHLSVYTPPTFTLQPTNTQVVLCNSCSLTCTATSDENLTYTWKFNGATLPSGITYSNNNATLVITNAQTKHAGKYSCIATSTGGSTTSTSATLVVNIPAYLTKPPTKTITSRGATLTISSAAAGTAPLSYQWYFNDDPITNQIAASLKLTKVQTNQEGNYKLTVYNNYGTNVSTNFQIYVKDVPYVVTGPTNSIGDESNSVTFSASLGGRPPITYAWYKTGNTNVCLSTSNTMTLVNLVPTNAGSYYFVATNIDGKLVGTATKLAINEVPRITKQPTNTITTEKATLILTATATGVKPITFYWFNNTTNFLGTNAGVLTLSKIPTNYEGPTYFIASNRLGQVTGTNFNLYVKDLPSTITAPTNSIGDEGSNITFAIQVTGRAPFSYFWFKTGNTNTCLSTSNSMTLQNLDPTNKGTYYAVVTNIDGKLVSASAKLSINEKPRFKTLPKATITTKGGKLTLAALATGVSPITYYWVDNTNNFLGTNSGTLSYPNVQTNLEGTFFVVASNRLGTVTSTNIGLYVKNPPKITLQPKSGITNEMTSYTFSVAVEGREPLSYAWYKSTSKTEILSLTNSLTITNLGTNHAGTYYVTITNVDGKIQSANVTLAINAKPRIIASPSNTNTVHGKTITLITKATGAIPMYYLWYYQDNTFIGSSSSAGLTLKNIQTNQAGTIYCIASNYVGTATSEVFTVTVKDPPVITLPPANIAAKEGTNITLSVTAIGKPNLNYQWTHAESAIAGATNSSLLLTNVGETTSGTYYVTVSNEDGTTNSTKATVTVLLKPVFTQQPVSASGTNGQTVTLTCATSGTGVKYQWTRDGISISRATANKITISLKSTTTGTYKVLATNSGGTTESEAASVTISNASNTSGDYQETKLATSLHIKNFGFDEEGNPSIIFDAPENITVTLQSTSDMQTWDDTAQIITAEGENTLTDTNHNTECCRLYRIVFNPSASH